jgi:myo-inositol-1(or 4)-monophosphatase
MPTRKLLDLNRARQVAIGAAEAAGELLYDAEHNGHGTIRSYRKDADGDVVTELDLASEQVIVGHLRTAYPDHRIITEELGLIDPALPGPDAGAPEWTWLVDPVDGTNNLAIGLPAYVVGISLCRQGRPLVGVVHEPLTRRTWSATRGEGASGPNGQLPAPGPASTTHRKVIAWTQGHSVSRDDVEAIALRLSLERYARRVLQLWAPLLCWVLLARGDIDGFVGYRAEAVDLPAGLLIALEAGLTVKTLDGDEFDGRYDRPDSDRCFVAAHPADVDELLTIVRAADWSTEAP